MRYPNAEWIGPTVNETPGGMIDVLGLVLHIEEGTESGTESWFRNPEAQASSHFLNPKSGGLRQMVDTRDKAWAEAAGNAHWISVENEGYAGDSLTESQLNNIAGLYSWLNEVYSVPFVVSDSPNVKGMGWHGMGGTAWGGHFDCPGDPIKNQRPVILDRAAGHMATGDGGAPWPGEYLHIGSKGSNVAHVQQKLRERGWRITVDGDFGSQTDRVVRAFQTEKGLKVDGWVGPVTWHAIETLPVT